jgi:hypothetical protein
MPVYLRILSKRLLQSQYQHPAESWRYLLPVRRTLSVVEWSEDPEHRTVDRLTSRQ